MAALLITYGASVLTCVSLACFAVSYILARQDRVAAPTSDRVGFAAYRAERKHALAWALHTLRHG
jgi:hypothetical protein